MSTRSFATKRLIPAAQALTLVTTAACSGDPLVGSWNGVSFTYDGDTNTLPYTYSYTYEGTTYESTFSHSVALNDEFGGTFTFAYTYSVDGVLQEDDSTSYSASATKVSKGVWDVSVPDYYTLELTCTAAGDTMNCVGIDEDDATYDIDYVRAL